MSKLTAHDKSFIQGVACAVAVVVYSEGTGTHTKEALSACGVHSVKDLRDCEVCDYDIDILRDTLREMQQDQKRKKKK